MVIYHSPCSDGWCAAWIMHRCLGGDPELVPAKYGDDPPIVDGRDVYVVDFCYPRDVMKQMYSVANTLLVMDHHKTAEAECRDLNYCVFDSQMSGAGLAYWWCHSEGKIQLLLDEPSTAPVARGMHVLMQYVQDRDLFRFAMDASESINAALRSYPWDLDTWDHLAKEAAVTPMTFLKEGEAIQRYRKQIAEQSIRHAYDVLIAGHVVKATLCSTGDIVSEVAGELAKGASFGATFCPTSDGQVVVSLRSEKRGADVGEIAKMYGGGGHKHSAGFRVNYATIESFDVTHGPVLDRRIITTPELKQLQKT